MSARSSPRRRATRSWPTSRRCRAAGIKLTQTPLGEAAARGTFVAPTLIEIAKVADVEREVFGPVLHVLRYRREALDALIDDINAAGYGLTFGLHTRIDETIARVTERIEAGNIYVNRNIIGATVGVQPFGGSRLSGTGPKAGGPLYLSRLAAEPAPGALDGVEGAAAAHWAVRVYIDWLRTAGHEAEAERCVGLMARSPLGARVELKGPVGERNVYALKPRGRIAAVAASQSGRADPDRRDPRNRQRCGRQCRRNAGAEEAAARARAPDRAWRSTRSKRLCSPAPCSRAKADALAAALRQLADRPGPIVRLQALTPARLAAGEDYNLAELVEECAIATNTAAAGGNASLMTIG